MFYIPFWNTVITILNLWSMSRPEHWNYWFTSMHERLGVGGLAVAVILHAFALWGAFDLVRGAYSLVRRGSDRLRFLHAADCILREEHGDWYELQSMLHAIAMCVGIVAVVIRALFADPVFEVGYMVVYAVYAASSYILARVMIGPHFKDVQRKAMIRTIGYDAVLLFADLD